jgi:maleylacetoacetate isomerase
MQDPLPEPCLFGYWRSSAAYRVRIALNLKRITARQVSVQLQLGEQTSDEHRARNPAGLVPVWRDPDGFTLAQSLAIIDYLDEMYPDPPLLPDDPRQKAVCREIAYTIACDIHPIGNLRVLEKLTADCGAGAGARAAWNRHWIGTGFGAIEARLAAIAGRHAVGDQITVADICLVPQVYNARRAGLDLAPYPRIAAADAAAREQTAFAAAAPEAQLDAP